MAHSYNYPDDLNPNVISVFDEDVGNQPVNSVGVKYDQGKLRMDLISPEMLDGLAEVLTFGAGKYGDRNWEKGIDLDRLYAATLRHLNAWRKGEDLDPESGLHHVKHALVDIGMITTFIERGCDND